MSHPSPTKDNNLDRLTLGHLSKAVRKLSSIIHKLNSTNAELTEANRTLLSAYEQLRQQIKILADSLSSGFDNDDTSPEEQDVTVPTNKTCPTTNDFLPKTGKHLLDDDRVNVGHPPQRPKLENMTVMTRSHSFPNLNNRNSKSHTSTDTTSHNSYDQQQQPTHIFEKETTLPTTSEASSQKGSHTPNNRGKISTKNPYSQLKIGHQQQPAICSSPTTTQPKLINHPQPLQQHRNNPSDAHNVNLSFTPTPQIGANTRN